MSLLIRSYGSRADIVGYEKSPKKKDGKTTQPHSQEVWVLNSGKEVSLYGSRRPDNIRRTRTVCLRRVLSAIETFGSPLLITLTIKGDAADVAYASESLRRFQVRLRNEFSNPQSIFIPELSPRGRIHFHGLLFNVPLSLGDKRSSTGKLLAGRERNERILAQLWGEGYVDAKQTDGSPGLGYYLTKYVTKAGEQELFNGIRMLRITRGFPKETVVRGEHARLIKQFLSRKYPDRTPYRWHCDFLGNIEKNTFILDQVDKKYLELLQDKEQPL